MKSNLNSLVTLFHHMDSAVGIDHIKQMTLEILKEKLPKLKAAGYGFIPLVKQLV